MERNYMSNSFKDHGIIRSRSGYNPSPSKLKDYSWSQISQAHVGFGEDHHHQDQDSDLLGPGGGGTGVFSWPPRSYTCSFCKREFRSAQALGGHMNVHRRDRARLRQSSPLMDSSNNVGQFSTTASHHPPLNLNLCPNHFSPNPSDHHNNNNNDDDNVVSPPTNCTGLSSVVSASSPGPALSSSSPCFGYRGEDKINRAGNIVEGGVLLLDPLSPRGAGSVKKGARKSFFGSERSLAGFKLQEGCKFLKNGDMVRLDLEIGVLGDHTKKEVLDLELRLGCS